MVLLFDPWIQELTMEVTTTVWNQFARIKMSNITKTTISKAYWTSATLHGTSKILVQDLHAEVSNEPLLLFYILTKSWKDPGGK